MTKTNDITIKDAIKHNRPKVSLSTVNTYMSNIRSLARDLKTPINSIDDIVSNYQAIFDNLKDKPLTTRKTKLSAFIVALDSDKNTPEIEKILKEYRAQVKMDGDHYDKREESQKLTESQQKNFIPWSDVEKVYSNLKLEAEPLFKLPRLNVNQFMRLQLFVLLSLYVLIPPRRSLDYADFKIRNVNEKEDNYLEKSGKKDTSKLVFNKYKNASRIGVQKVEIPNSLKSILTKWISKNPYDYLIVNTKGNKITQSKINDFLNSIFGKNIGSSMLRHIYLTKEVGNIDLEKLNKLTHDVGNKDISRTLKYVSKDDVKK